MFDSLSSKLEKVFRDLRGLGKISEANASAALREVRQALLEADVNFKVARDFIERVRAQSLGQEVIQSIQPGQQVIKIIHDELVQLLGATNAGLQLSGNPSCVLMVGLHGSGKTTSSGKLGRLLHKQGRTPLLVAADVYRPAAMEQLQTVGKQAALPVYAHPGATDVLQIAREALAFARAHNRNTLIFDTAGRLQIDEPLVRELVALRDLVKPQETLLVLDAATGQEAVSVATHFDQALNITGAILTKLDGDARGGAALSLRAVTGKPIKFAGVGEKLDEFEPFHPERMASRILGMGDVLTLIEKAQETVDQDKAAELQKKVLQDRFDLEDFLEQLQQMKRVGPLNQILEMLPKSWLGWAGALEDEEVDPKELDRIEAIIRSMTPDERHNPGRLNGSRKKRIARGSGTTVADINSLLKQFDETQVMMKQMMGAQQGVAGRVIHGAKPMRRKSARATKSKKRSRSR